MVNPVRSIIERSLSKTSYNLITACTHERYEGHWKHTPHKFYAFMRPGVFKPGWNESFGPIPDNYTLLNPNDGDKQIPNWLNPEMVVSQNKFGQFQILGNIAKAYQIPLISVEHTCSMPFWSPEQKKELHEMRGHINVFITRYSLESWEWEDRNDTVVIPHAVDTELFKPDFTKERKNHILTVGNDYIGRDYVLNFSQYKRVCLDNNLPVRPVGDTPGLSQSPANVEELVKEFQSSRIFLNTHHISPIPTSLLEAMGSGCAVVSCNTCAIPDYVEHGENGFLYNNDEEALGYLQILLNDEDLAKKMGDKARETIKEKCSVSRFVNQWNEVFEKARKL